MTSLPALLVLASLTATASDPHVLYDRLCARVAAAYDSTRGGFVSKGGAPSESAVELAFLRAAETGDTLWTHRATATIGWTRGLLDTLTGGYFHGGNGRDAGEEALSKNVFSNGRRLEVLVQAAAATGEPGYMRDARSVADFMERVLLDGRGGFVSAQVGDRDLVPAANGFAIHAWLTWAAARLDLRAKDFALRSLDRIWESCWMPGVGLVRHNSFGEVSAEPMLVDQVEMGRSFVLASRMCGRARDSERARMLGDLLIARYQEPGRGGFRTSSMPRRNGSIQSAPRDGSENARAASFLSDLAELTGEPRYHHAAERAWGAFGKGFDRLGLDAADWALALRTTFHPDPPAAPDWSQAVEPPTPPRKRSVTIRAGND